MTDVDDPFVPGLRDLASEKLVRELVTPEGVALRFKLAGAGERAAAFVLDAILQIVLVAAIAIALSTAAGSGASWLRAVITVVSFLVVNFYFAFFEIRWQGQTPGKRRIGIRVIDARGGQLEASSVLARNLIRELEIWTPVRFLILNRLLWPGAPQWAMLVAVAWTLVFLLMPLFNKDKLRVGDLIAGTRVVIQPKVVLLPDLTDGSEAPEIGPVAPRGAAFEFSDAQLAIYGIYELQVLEGVLRQNASDLGYWEAVRTVSEKIRTKLDYAEVVRDDERFLKEFYAALRAHLEKQMLFGQRRVDKHAAKK